MRPRARGRDFAGLKVWQWRPMGDAALNVSFTLELGNQRYKNAFQAAPSQGYAVRTLVKGRQSMLSTLHGRSDHAPSPRSAEGSARCAGFRAC